MEKKKLMLYDFYPVGHHMIVLPYYGIQFSRMIVLFHVRDPTIYMVPSLLILPYMVPSLLTRAGSRKLAQAAPYFNHVHHQVLRRGGQGTA